MAMCNPNRTVPVSDDLPVESLEAGDALLINSTTTQLRESVAYELLGAASPSDEATIIVSTDSTARLAKHKYDEFAPADAPEPTVIDCLGNYQQDIASPVGSRHVPSPANLTKLGVEITDVIDDALESDSTPRVLIKSILPLVMYSDFRSVFQFLHGFIGRIQAVGGVAILTMNMAIQKTNAVEKLKQLTDGTVHVKNSGGDRSISAPQL